MRKMAPSILLTLVLMLTAGSLGHAQGGEGLQGAVWAGESVDGRRYEFTLTGDRLSASCVVVRDNPQTYARKGENCPPWDDAHYGRLAAARVVGFQIYGPNWKGEITPDGKVIKFYLPNWLTGQGTQEFVYVRER